MFVLDGLYMFSIINYKLFYKIYKKPLKCRKCCVIMLNGILLKGGGMND